MELQDESERNRFEDDYDDGHNSDIESRLYAEIHYSNTIIGEENHSPNSDKSTGVDTNKRKNSNIPLPDVNRTLQTIRVTQNPEHIKDSSTIPGETPKGYSNLQLQDDTMNSKKRRIITNEQDQSNKSGKIQKTNITDSNEEQQKSGSNLENVGTKIVNPYNKTVTDKKGMKLLDPMFLNIFFGKPKKKKKDEKVSLKKKRKSLQLGNIINKKTDTNISNASTNQQKPDDKFDVAKKAVQESKLTDAEEIIDISSESSNDSLEDTSKYSTVKPTDEKLKKNKPQSKPVNSDSESDEESIYEIPIPPKPAPPVIELKDSDAERESDSDSDDDSFLNDSLNVTIDECNTTVNTSMNTTLNTTLNTTKEVCNIDSDSEDNIILNCTEVQRGVASLDEIKRLSHQDREKSNTNDGVCNNENQHVVQHDSENSSTEKVANIVNDKQRRKTVDRKSMPLEEYFFEPMTVRMKSFYNNSWGGENFDMETLKSNMSRDPKKWTILNTDLVINGPRRKRYFGMVCARCQKEGHRQKDCPEKFKNPTCHMCGIEGHFVTACPQTKCLSCGRQQAMYRSTCGYCEKIFCNRCKSNGHRDNCCPDLWRRYHNTISEPNPKVPLNQKNVMKPQHTLYCCNCAKQGHDSAFCRKLRWSQHSPNPSHIVSYHGPGYPSNNTPPKNVNNSDDRSFKPTDVLSPTLHPIVRNDDSFRYNSNARNEESFQLNFNNTANSSNNPLERSFNSRVDNIQERQNPLSLPINTQNNRCIFKISRSPEEIRGWSSTKLSLIVPKENGWNSFENWQPLYKFLNVLSKHIPTNFSLEEKSKQLFMTIECPRKKNLKYIQKLIRQYSSRTNVERSLMYLYFEKDYVKILNHLDYKFNELHMLKDDPLQLYEETKHLKEIVTNTRMAEAQRKLLMLLHREGFINDSLRMLRKLYDNFKKSNNKFKDTGLIEYTYHYNNVFIPYKLNNLADIIEDYKAHVNRCESLRNNPILFPLQQNEIASEQIQPRISPTDTSNILQSFESNSLLHTLSSLNKVIDTSINYNPTATSGNVPARRLIDKPNGSCIDDVNCKNEKNKKKREKRYNKLVQKARKLVKQARGLGAPRLLQRMKTIENALSKNDTNVKYRHVKSLEALIDNELKKRR